MTELYESSIKVGKAAVPRARFSLAAQIPQVPAALQAHPWPCHPISISCRAQCQMLKATVVPSSLLTWPSTVKAGCGSAEKPRSLPWSESTAASQGSMPSTPLLKTSDCLWMRLRDSSRD